MCDTFQLHDKLYMNMCNMPMYLFLWQKCNFLIGYPILEYQITLITPMVIK